MEETIQKIEEKRLKRKEYLKEYCRKWHQRPQAKSMAKRYRQSPEGKATKKKYSLTSKGIIARKKHVIRNINSWENLIPKEARCEICNKLIIFNSGDLRNSIHFDHKTGNEKITLSPKTWLQQHYASQKNIGIWLSCKFGFLCHRCNVLLPTLNRIEWLLKALEYASKQ